MIWYVFKTVYKILIIGEEGVGKTVYNTYNI